MGGCVWLCTTCYSDDIISTSYMCCTSGLPRDIMRGVRLRKNEKGRLVITCKAGGSSYKLSIQVKNE